MGKPRIIKYKNEGNLIPFWRFA